MKRTTRIGALTKILTDNPNQTFSLKHFCDLFGAAKSSISEDIQIASQSISASGFGSLETIPGAKGGVKYVPDISMEQISLLQEEFCKRLSDSSRMVGGNFLYTSDIFYDPNIVNRIAMIFAKKFKNAGADYVCTIETKGIPLAFMVAHYLNLPLVVVRRDAKISEGSTISINYFSGSSDRLQKMSMAKRAIEPNSQVLIIDDFMRGGGSIVGIREMIGEFNCQVCGIGVAISSTSPEKKKISKYTSIVYLEDISPEKKTITLKANDNLF